MAAIIRPATITRSISSSILRPTYALPSRHIPRRQPFSSISSEPVEQSPIEPIENAPIQPSFEPLSYHVHRTPGQQLPIYHLAKAGGNKHLTRIRKITGSVEDLRNDLREALGLEEKEISVNNVNKHIVIKGWKKFEVAKFLEEKKF